MKNDHVVTLKSDANCAWIAVLDPVSGKRGRYTVYRLYRWADKRADIIGRELDLRAARKLVGKREPQKPENLEEPNFDHDCDWRKAAMKLAKCVVWTIQTGVFPENLASLRLHLSCGFRVVGVRERIGRLDGTWRDVVFLERRSKEII